MGVFELKLELWVAFLVAECLSVHKRVYVYCVCVLCDRTPLLSGTCSFCVVLRPPNLDGFQNIIPLPLDFESDPRPSHEVGFAGRGEGLGGGVSSGGGGGNVEEGCGRVIRMCEGVEGLWWRRRGYVVPTPPLHPRLPIFFV